MEDDLLYDLFSSIKASLAFRKMFGGKGIYADGVIFAIVLQGELMLKGDEKCAEAYEAAGMKRWVYPNKKSGKEVAMPYWSVPESALEGAEEMEPFARLAYEAGLRAKIIISDQSS